MKLKVVSFNVDCDNHDPHRIKQLIDDHQPDILCLQEVSERLKTHLEGSIGTRYPYMNTAVDHFADGYFDLSPTRKQSHLMILSRVPFAGTPLKHVHMPIGSRTLFGWFRGWQECREHHCVDVVVNNTLLRVINLHIACSATPRNKWRQLKHALRHHTDHDGETLLCGDFNITTTLKFRHGIPYCIRRVFKSRYSIQKSLQEKELRIFARILTKRGLHDVCGEHVTHPVTGLILDKVLVSQGVQHASEALTFDYQYGSDHFPIGTVIELQT